MKIISQNLRSFQLLIKLSSDERCYQLIITPMLSAFESPIILVGGDNNASVYSSIKRVATMNY